MSAWRSNSRPKRMNAVPRPMRVPCETTLPTRPPMIAPMIAPATDPISYFVALLACAVPCRSTMWLSSCAITPATWPSFVAASIMPRFTNIGPARQGEGVDVSRVDDLERVAESGMPELRGNRRDQPPADGGDIGIDLRIAHQWQLLTYLCRPPDDRAGHPARECICWRALESSSVPKQVRQTERAKRAPPRAASSRVSRTDHAPYSTVLRRATMR